MTTTIKNLINTNICLTDQDILWSTVYNKEESSNLVVNSFYPNEFSDIEDLFDFVNSVKAVVKIGDYFYTIEEAETGNSVDMNNTGNFIKIDAAKNINL